jgi:hypothetical protein
MRYVRHTLKQTHAEDGDIPQRGEAGGEPPARPGSAQLTVAPRDCREA